MAITTHRKRTVAVARCRVRREITPTRVTLLVLSRVRVIITAFGTGAITVTVNSIDTAGLALLERDPIHHGPVGVPIPARDERAVTIASRSVQRDAIVNDTGIALLYMIAPLVDDHERRIRVSIPAPRDGAITVACRDIGNRPREGEGWPRELALLAQVIVQHAISACFVGPAIGTTSIAGGRVAVITGLSRVDPQVAAKLFMTVGVAVIVGDSIAIVARLAYG
jgi:hypothetical protein